MSTTTRRKPTEAQTKTLEQLRRHWERTYWVLTPIGFDKRGDWELRNINWDTMKEAIVVIDRGGLAFGRSHSAVESDR